MWRKHLLKGGSCAVNLQAVFRTYWSRPCCYPSLVTQVINVFPCIPIILRYITHPLVRATMHSNLFLSFLPYLTSNIITASDIIIASLYKRIKLCWILELNSLAFSLWISSWLAVSLLSNRCWNNFFHMWTNSSISICLGLCSLRRKGSRESANIKCRLSLSVYV